MNNYIEERRFKFRGFNGIGECYLRVKKVDNDGFVFLCTQLLNYQGTSVTNGVEEILYAAVKCLAERDELPKSFRPPFYARHKAGRLVMSVVRHARWVEHYPPGAGILPDGSYALVSFADDLSPVWNYMSRADAARFCEVEEEFFNVDPISLVYEKK